MQACLDMGGLALAAPAKPAVNKPAFTFLKAISQTLKKSEASASGNGGAAPVVDPVDTVPAFWMSAAHLSPDLATKQPGGAAPGWTWFPTVNRGSGGGLLLSNSSAEWPMAANETRWEAGYPKPTLFVNEPGMPVQSCAAAVWPEGATGEMWRNYPCSSHDVRYFVRSPHSPDCTALHASAFVRYELDSTPNAWHSCIC
jgi:hypothetical protein